MTDFCGGSLIKLIPSEGSSFAKSVGAAHSKAVAWRPILLVVIIVIMLVYSLTIVAVITILLLQ